MEMTADHGGAVGVLQRSSDASNRPPSKITLVLAGSHRFLDDDHDFLQGLATLTIHQRIILDQIARGQLNKQIAHSRGIAECTVKTHVAAILRRLNVSSRTQAAVTYAVLVERYATTPSHC